MIQAFLGTPEGNSIFQLTTLFNYSIRPWDFQGMSKNQINLLLAIREKEIHEEEVRKDLE